MIAVISTGGKQYVVKEGEELKVEKLEAEQGAQVSFEVMLVAEEDGSKVEIGSPFLDKKVTAEVMEQGRARKVSVVKFKPKVRYKKRVGHRQAYTKVKINKIG
ncbi:50S ribosomal protein L21 [Patescibacteria group bacterium]|nr:50S ribosomal protein L21 [Patescibacteria group bacterium]MBU1034385.1 50S ribosomal protein L21 [Patescibacteria group bacterium]MBU1629769.1 50S ribosomal protein L21 [Patescibacteria group bacterium]MBU1907931.1 50S ribosomal protein L21 [Patescibacteria group bacterium]